MKSHDPAATSKRCTGCGEVKPMEAFHRKSQVIDGRTSQCADCRAGRHAAASPEATKSRSASATRQHRMRKYGLTKEQAEAAADIQYCQATGIRLTTGYGMDSSCVDHSHVHGHVRGVVSKRVNMILGAAEDDVDLLEHCIRYLLRTAEAGFDWAEDYKTWTASRDLG